MIFNSWKSFFFFLTKKPSFGESLLLSRCLFRLFVFQHVLSCVLTHTHTHTHTLREIRRTQKRSEILDILFSMSVILQSLSLSHTHTHTVQRDCCGIYPIMHHGKHWDLVCVHFQGCHVFRVSRTSVTGDGWVCVTSVLDSRSL